MLNVISSEYYKIFRSKIFYIILIILFSLTVINLVVSVSPQNLSATKAKTEEAAISTYQGIYDANMVFCLIFLFVVCLVTAEFTNGSIRQMVCHGIARWKLVVGRYIAISSVITLMLFVFTIINFITEIFTVKLGEVDIAAIIRMNLGLFCMFLGVTGIATFLSYLFKNSAITATISIFLLMGQNLIASFFVFLEKSSICLKYFPSTMRTTIIDFSAQPAEVVRCAAVFLLFAAVTTMGSCLLFSLRDVG